MTAEPGAGDQRMPEVQRGHPGAHELNARKRAGRLGGVGHTLTLNGPAQSGHRVNYRRFHRFLRPGRPRPATTSGELLRRLAAVAREELRGIYRR